MKLKLIGLLVVTLGVGISHALEISYFSLRSPENGKRVFKKEEFPNLSDAVKAEFSSLISFCENEQNKIKKDNVTINPIMFTYSIAITCKEHNREIGAFYVSMNDKMKIVKKGIYPAGIPYPNVEESEKMFREIIMRMRSKGEQK